MADDSAPATTDAGPAVTPPTASDVIAGALPGILDRARVIVSPYPFGVSDGDSLRITTVCSQPGVVLELHTRRVYKPIGVTIDRFVHAPNSNRTVKSDDFPLAAGFVTNCTVFATSGAPLVGQCYVIIQLLRGIGAGAFVMGTLCANMVTQVQPLGWPGSPIVNSLEAEPVVRNIIGTQPAAGAQIREFVPAGARWELLSVLLQLATSGAGGTRLPDLRIISTTTVGQYLSNVGVPPGTAAALIQFGPNLPNVVYAGFSYGTGGFAQRVLLRAGDSFGTDTPGFDAADQYLTPWYQVREWMEVA